MCARNLAPNWKILIEIIWEQSHTVSRNCYFSLVLYNGHGKWKHRPEELWSLTLAVPILTYCRKKAWLTDLSGRVFWAQLPIHARRPFTGRRTWGPANAVLTKRLYNLIFYLCSLSVRRVWAWTAGALQFFHFKWINCRPDCNLDSETFSTGERMFWFTESCLLIGPLATFLQ